MEKGESLSTMFVLMQMPSVVRPVCVLTLLVPKCTVICSFLLKIYLEVYFEKTVYECIKCKFTKLAVQLLFSAQKTRNHFFKRYQLNRCMRTCCSCSITNVIMTQ